MAYEFKSLKVEISDRIAVLTINRPEALNALSVSLIGELSDFVDHVARDDSVGAIIVTGAGEKAFVAGADIAELNKLDRESGEHYSTSGNKAMRKLELLRKPVIAAINGFALGGGCELAMACHIRIASEKAKFGQPEVNLGLIPGFGGTQRLARIVGIGRAAQLILSAEIIDAQEAYRIGLVNKVVAPDQLLDTAKALALQILTKAPLAVAHLLEAIYGGQELVLESALAHEAMWFGAACGSEDMKEGTGAFLEKRKPGWNNK